MYELKNVDKKLIAFAYLSRVANRQQHKMDTRFKDLTAKQWFVLMSLGFFNEPPTLKQLSLMCDSSHQNTKQIVMKLREKGFVTVENDSADGRAVRISPTEKLERWDEEHEDSAKQFVDKMFDGLPSWDVAVLSSALLKVFENLGDIAET
jgi:DNA-binding MarR family transcriptional regulator